MSTIQEIQEDIISNFELFDDWDDKYAYIIELGKKLPVLDTTDKTDDNIIRGCQSLVWMTSRLIDHKVHYYAESDAIIVKGLVSLLLRVYSGSSPDEILGAEPYFMERIGMQKHLSMTRSNGLVSMIKTIKIHALAYQTKLAQ